MEPHSLKFLPLITALAFLFLPARYASAAPAVVAALALLGWFLENREPPRAIGWAGWLVACAVAGYKDAAMLFPSALVGGVGLLAVELLSRRNNDGSVTPLPCLAGTGVLAIAAFYFGIAGNPFKPISDARRIVAFGDSLTAGVPGDGVSAHWPAVVARLSGGEAVVLAHPGDTTAASFARWGERIRSRAWKPGDNSWQPDVIVVLLGGNEILRKQSPDDIRRDLRQMVEALLPAGCPVLLVSVPGAIFSDQYSDTWKDIAAEFDSVEYMDQSALRSIYTSGSGTLPDRIHLNATGQDMLGQAIYARLTGK